MAGYLADQVGRTRALMGTILLFSVASLGASTSQSVIQLLMWRALLGIGIGLALGITSAFFLFAAALIFTLPDRSGQALEA